MLFILISSNCGINTMASSQILSSLLGQWLALYNVRMAHCVAQFLDVKGESHGSLKKSITFVTPSGEFVKMVTIDRTTRVSEIVPLGHCMCRMGQFDVALEGLVWDLGGEFTLCPILFQGIQLSNLTSFSQYQRMASNPVKPLLAIYGGHHLYMWNPVTSECSMRVASVAFGRVTIQWSPCGKFLAVIQRFQVSILEITDTSATKVFSTYVGVEIDWNADGTQFAIGTANNGVDIYSMHTLQRIIRFRHSMNCLSSTEVIWMSHSNLATFTTSGLSIWDTETGVLAQGIQINGFITAVHWHPKRNRIIVGLNEQSNGADVVRVWDMTTWIEQTPLTLEGDSIISSNLDPNNKYFITSNHVWDVDTGKCFIQHTDMLSARWNQAGTALAVNGRGGVTVYQTATGTRITTISNHTLLCWNQERLLTREHVHCTLAVWR